MKNPPIKRNSENLVLARNLRRNMTRQERHLWYDFLRFYPVKFYKQRIIDNYIVDFYCHKARLVIELDGSQHYTEQGATSDAERTAVLENYNLFVLRFSNNEIDTQFERVCRIIDNIIRERISLSEDDNTD